MLRRELDVRGEGLTSPVLGTLSRRVLDHRRRGLPGTAIPRLRAITSTATSAEVAPELPVLGWSGAGPQSWNVGPLGFVTSFGRMGAGEMYVLSASGKAYASRRRN